MFGLDRKVFCFTVSGGGLFSLDLLFYVEVIFELKAVGLLE